MDYKYNKARKSRPKYRKGAPYNKQTKVSRAPALAATARRDGYPMFFQPRQAVFPASTTCWLRYNDTNSVTMTTGSVGTYVLRANDLFDPDFTSTGHQPMGFDQVMVFYNHFVVLKSRLVCTFQNTANAPVFCQVRVDADSSAITTPSRLLEFGGAQVLVCEAKGVSGTTRTAEISVDIARLQGVSQAAITSDPSLQGSVAASPAEVSYYHISAWNDQSASGSVFVNFTVEYLALFAEPRNPTQS